MNELRNRGPHVDAWHPWLMSQISAIFGTDDDEEIHQSLYLIANVNTTVIESVCRIFYSHHFQNTAGLGLIHESQNIYNNSDYTRPWFAWANSYFAEMILDLAERKPHLIFTDSRSNLSG